MYSFISYLISKCFHLDSFMKTWLFKSGFTTKDSPCMIIPGSHYGTLSLDQNCFTKITVIFRYLFMLTSFYHVSFKTTKILLLLGSTGTSIFEKWFFCFCFFFFSILYFSSVQLLHCVRLFVTPYSTPGFPVHHQLPELGWSHVHQVGDAIQPSHPLSSPFSPAFSLSQHHGLFQWVSSLHQVAKVLEFHLQYHLLINMN